LCVVAVPKPAWKPDGTHCALNHVDAAASLVDLCGGLPPPAVSRQSLSSKSATRINRHEGLATATRHPGLREQRDSSRDRVTRARDARDRRDRLVRPCDDAALAPVAMPAPAWPRRVPGNNPPKRPKPIPGAGRPPSCHAFAA
jgi:hypothetical protein